MANVGASEARLARAFIELTDPRLALGPSGRLVGQVID